MGKVLKILGIIFLVIVVLVVGLLIWSHQKGKSVQEDFFTAVLSGDPAKVLEMFHPKLREEVDEPVLAEWMAAVKEHLGDFVGLDTSDFSTKASTTVGGSSVESEGTVKFTKGTARSRLRLIDGKITMFHVESDTFGDTWLTRIEDPTLYHECAKRFLTALIQGDVNAALEMMHESLRAKFDSETFAASVGQMRERMGEIGAIERVDDLFEPGPPQSLTVRYRIELADDQITGRVRFSFDGMKGHLSAFKIPE